MWTWHCPTAHQPPLSPSLPVALHLSTLRRDRTTLPQTRGTPRSTPSHLQHLDDIIFLPIAVSRSLSLSLPRTTPLPDDAVEAECEDEDEE